MCSHDEAFKRLVRKWCDVRLEFGKAPSLSTLLTAENVTAVAELNLYEEYDDAERQATP
jgi:hypothetical protein